ncbi:MAG: phosphoribosylamine--glycine ligase [Acidobacteriota bacterium]|nr:phosphoribosylamine--glycine ligase [Acidobacteriota bacterium]
MRVLVVGSGGREHALCWKLAQSPELGDLFCAPGNPGIESVADLVPIAADEIQKLADFAADLKIDLTVVGPELPLTLGIADEFANRGLALFGPSREAARLEGSKVFAKRFMKEHGIPTAEFEVVLDADQASKAAKRFGFPVVLKADGLAAGKGVVIPRNDEELSEAFDVFFSERRFGDAGARLVVEEFLEGEEVSLMAVVDGQRFLPLATSKDYKRIGDDDQGPNTGGMGAHSPAGVLARGDAKKILDDVMQPVVAGMAAHGNPFRGFLYAGIILTPDGLRVLEFNVRLGDPEAQPLMMRMDEDLLPVLASGATGRFEKQRLDFQKAAAACIVLAAQGYPGSPVLGEPIEGIATASSREGVEVFHGGTRLEEGRLTTAGGRVLNVCATAPDLRGALQQAYQAAEEIRWSGKTFRSDIGRRVLMAIEGAAGEASR